MSTKDGGTDTAGRAASLLAKEEGLERRLTVRQLGMIAIGGAIGTGLFLGSSAAIHLAGPSVVLTYIIGGAIVFTLMSALAEMAVAHPAAGSFGIYAEIYLSRWAGFVVRYTYWAAQCIAIGGEATAVAIYCHWWLPGVPGWIWIVSLSAGVIYVNARSVASFGEVEYWFAMIKVVAIVAFIVFGLVLLGGFHFKSANAMHNLTAYHGIFPNGFKGTWLALSFVIFSYYGTEVVAVTAGEAKDPQTAVPKAMRSVLLRLALFYFGAMAILVAVVPWVEIQHGAAITASPFVTVFRLIGVPAAADVVNFVVLTAALSSMNTNLYLVTRMLYSLSRGGYAPRWAGRLSRRGTPVRALLASTAGLGVATGLAVVFPKTAYIYLLGIALFGGIFVWLMIFVTHVAFRRAMRAQGMPRLSYRARGYPATTVLGFLALLGILVTTWWVPEMKITLIAGVPWLIVISLTYLLWRRGFGRRR